MSSLSTVTTSAAGQEILPLAFVRSTEGIVQQELPQVLPFEQSPSVWDRILHGNTNNVVEQESIAAALLQLRGGGRVVEKDGLKWSGRSRIIFEEVLKVTPKPFRIFPKNTMLKGLKKLGEETVTPKQVIDICKKSTPKKYLPKVEAAINRVK